MIRRTYTAMTARRAILNGLKPERSYGNVIVITPPIEHVRDGEDVEGIGWVPMKPTRYEQHFFGWYKHISYARQRAAALNRTA